MKHKFYLILGTLAVGTTCRADVSQAEQAMRNGSATEALQALHGVTPCPELHYWKGRALAELQRYEEAVVELSCVDETHALYPYAARALMYCARRTPHTEAVLSKLSASQDPAIAALAKILLAEHTVQSNKELNLADYASADTDISGALLLLEAEQLRRAGNYDAAISKCREAEDKAPTLQREYSRILLSEIHYDKEKAEGDNEGKGEETLLKFISSHPDSVLLEEAFRRLDKRGAFTTSKYAIRKLEEWSRDTTAIYRALLASAITQRESLYVLSNEELGEIAVNRATGINPDYLPITVQINNEQARYLILHDKKENATAYYDRIPENKRDAYTLFYKARTMPAADPMALELYLKSAEAAPPALQETAYANALYCAHTLENNEAVQELLNKELPVHCKRVIKLTHAGLNLRKTPQQSRQELEEVLQMDPTPTQRVETVLQLTQLDIDENDAASALKRLSEFSDTERKVWPNEQVMRYYGLYLHALECEQEVGRATASHKPFLLAALSATKREDVRIAITLKLAKIYSEEGNHREALILLEDLAANAKDKDMKARALLLAGRESTQCLTLPAVTKGATLFAAAAEIDSPYRYRAAILNTAVLFRINDAQAAEQKILRIIKEIETERNATPGSTHLAEEYAFALTVKADIEAVPGTPEALKQAISTNEQVFAIPGLTQAWHSRAYLQQATLCSRVGWNERALLDYKNIINSLPASAKQATPDKAYILCLSGTGAIACLLKMEKWEEAADMADSIAEHPIGKEFEERTKHFKEWARLIRKTHFLPMKEKE
ncbi:MAG: hypothetical protein IKL98_03110 [Akkermansia sp.]|nr:hypothetical protein [Akkermansia sp.]